MNKIKVGDLIKWVGVWNDESEELEIDYGVVLALSKTGADTTSARVLFQNGKTSWHTTATMEVVSEG